MQTPTTTANDRNPISQPIRRPGRLRRRRRGSSGRSDSGYGRPSLDLPFPGPGPSDAGYRVAVTDLRGHGDSDTTFSAYGDVETAGDVLALIQELGGPAVIVGNSLGAAVAVLIAADHPDLVNGLVLVGPFVRNGKVSVMQRVINRVAMAPIWAASVWKAYLPKLYAGQRPADFEAYRAQVIAGLRRPGHAKAFSRTTHASHDPAEARLGDVTAPTLVIMGDQDPDFPIQRPRRAGSPAPCTARP